MQDYFNVREQQWKNGKIQSKLPLLYTGGGIRHYQNGTYVTNLDESLNLFILIY